MRERMLDKNDAGIFRELRLRACKEEPVAFTESFEDLAGEPLAHFTRYFDNGWVAGAFDGDTLVAIAGLYKCVQQKVAHKGNVWGVYCVPQARGQGISKRLLKMLLDAATEDGVEIVHLSTDSENAVTVGLYRSLGFVEWGLDRDFAKVGERVVHEIMMKKYLKA